MAKKKQIPIENKPTFEFNTSIYMQAANSDSKQKCFCYIQIANQSSFLNEKFFFRS